MTYVSVPTPVTATPTNNNANQGARFRSKTRYMQKGKGPKTNYYPNYCYYCDDEGHFTDDCNHFPSVAEKKAALKAKGRCEDCRSRKTDIHFCPLKHPCRICNGKHMHQLCEVRERNQQKQGR